MTIVKSQSLASYVAILVCTLFSVQLTSCGKQDIAPEKDPDEDAVFITSLESIHYDQLQVDTAIVKLDTYKKSFETPVTELDLGDLYGEVMDSVNIDLDLPDNTRLVEGLLLPEIRISDPVVSLATAGDSLIVNSFPFVLGFVPVLRDEVSQKLEGKISQLEIFRKYQRIVYSADVMIVARTSDGVEVQLEGNFKGSRLGTRTTDVIVH
ncbi:MAG: hypothetical protein ACTIK3_10465 [Sphingobacteriaceae bacterium]